MVLPALLARIAPPGSFPDGLVFDLDGTLWDSTETVARAWSRAINRTSSSPRTITAAEVAGVMGLSHRDIYRALFPGQTEDRQEALILACYSEEEREIHRYGGRLYPGVAEGLAALSKRYPLFIVSNCQRGYIESFLSWSGLGLLFADHECHGNTGLSKGENLLRVAGRNGLEAPVYLGDTLSDRRAAEAAGWPFVHARYGFGDAGDDCPAVSAFAELEEALLVNAS